MKRITGSLAFIIVVTATALLTGCPSEPPPPAADPPEPSDEAPEWPRTFTDAMGEQITLEAPPERVVSLSTGFTEAIFAMGAGDLLVGRVSFADYPPEARDVPSVGGVTDPSLEAIVEQEPDLVLTVRGTPKDVVKSIRRAGIPVIARDPISIEEVLDCIRDIGRYLDVEEDADELADNLAARVEEAAERGNALAVGQGRASTLFVVGLNPVFVAGEGHFVDDMIWTAGGINAATLVEGGNGGQWPSLSLETVVELDPDIVVVAMMLEEDLGEMDGIEALSDQPGWKDLSAVEREHVYTINPDTALRAGPRLVDALERMVEIIEDAIGGGPGDE
ncbi:MAG: ABC transporter substrate-binding protein [Armatimonadota bacterium]